jgi:hypothetical protein
MEERVFFMRMAMDSWVTGVVPLPAAETAAAASALLPDQVMAPSQAAARARRGDVLLFRVNGAANGTGDDRVV